jgi:hypothetical protein
MQALSLLLDRTHLRTARRTGSLREQHAATARRQRRLMFAM